jgi:hypothetical protein
LGASEQKDMCVTVRYVLHLVLLFGPAMGSKILRLRKTPKLLLITIISEGLLFHPLNTLGPERKHWRGGVSNPADGTVHASYAYRKHLSLFFISWPTLSIR